VRDPRDYKIDIAGLGEGENAPDGGAESEGEGRPFIGVNFACCGVYLRIYRNAEGTEYAGRCPKCGKPARILIGPGGTSERQFTVY
jgi:hypothetical protein